MSERTMVIPAPVALPGQKVEVKKNRIKSKVVFEPGTVERAEYTLYGDALARFSGRWSYDVVLDRRNPRGQWMRRHVCDASIRPWSGTVSEVDA